MSLRRTWTVLLACSIVALLAIAPGASAKPGYFVIPGYQAIDLNLKGSNGYRITIFKQGRRVYLLAEGKDGVVIYAARSLAPRGSQIKARLPGVGRISMRFQPLGPLREDPPDPFPGCRGGKAFKQPGYFVGAIRFRGERGYTSLRASRIRTAREIRAKEACKRFPEPKVDKTELFASSRSGGRSVTFDASSLVVSEGIVSTTFGASVMENRRGMAIFRSTFISGGEKGLVTGDTRPRPLSATVTPPAPFQGSGEFQRDAEGNSTWTGSLTVSFPGLAPLALTGPTFTARLCQHSGCTGHTIDGHSLPFAAR